MPAPFGTQVGSRKEGTSVNVLCKGSRCGLQVKAAVKVEGNHGGCSPVREVSCRTSIWALWENFLSLWERCLSKMHTMHIRRGDTELAAETCADLIVIETMTDLYEVKAAVLAAKETCRSAGDSDDDI